LVALESEPGRGGGVDLYTRGLVEAIADHASSESCRAVVFVWPEALPAWRDREWPGHVSFVALRPEAGPQPSHRRLLRAVGRRVGLELRPTQGAPFLARQIDGAGLDVVHFPRTLMYPRTLRTPTVLTCFDVQHEYFPEFFTPAALAARRRSYRESIGAATRLIVPSEFTRRSLIERLGVAAERMIQVPPGVGDEIRREDPALVAETASRLGLPSPYVIYPANPWPHKNHGRLMAALRACRTAQPDFPKLVVFGRLSEESRDYLSLAQAAGIENRVVDLGFLPRREVAAVYSGAAFMVFPSLFEGFGLPVIEAMACGCPVAAAGSTSLPEVAGDAALLFDAQSVEEMSAAMLRLWRSETLRQQLAARGRERAESFAWPAVLPRLLEVYRATAVPESKSGRKPAGGNSLREGA